MRVVNEIDNTCWKEFVDDHPQSNIFHTPEMFEVFARAKKHIPSFWAVVDHRQQPRALLCPVQVFLMNGVFRQFTTRAIAYGGVLCASEGNNQEALDLLLRTYNQNIEARILFTELRNLAELNGFRSVFNHNGYRFDGHLNYLIQLDKPEEEIWSKISKTGQQRIRSAVSKGVAIEEIRGRQEIPQAYSFLRNIYSQIQVPLADITLFEAAFDILAPLGMFKIFRARINDRDIGYRFLLIYKDRIIDWYAGVDRNYSSYSANELLVWHTLKWGKENQLKVFDFGGAGRPDIEYGPRVFKSKFGGLLVNFGRYTKIHAPAHLKLSQTAYQVLRRYL